MYKPSTLRTVAYVALVCCILGTIISLLAIAYNGSWQLYVCTASWLLLCYSSFLGIRLATYDLYDDDFKRLGYYLYGILVLFVLFLCFSFFLGIFAAFYVAFQLHVQKTNMSSWMKEQAEKAAMETVIVQKPQE